MQENTLERLCDDLLAFTNKWKGVVPMNGGDLLLCAMNSDYIDATSPDFNQDLFYPALSRLRHDGHIQPNWENDTYSITDKGRVFVNTTSYVQQKERWKLEQLHSERAQKKLQQDLRLNSYYLKSRWLPHFLSSISVIISLFSLYYSVKRDTLHKEQTNTSKYITDTLKNHN